VKTDSQNGNLNDCRSDQGYARWTIGEIRERAAVLRINGAAYKTRTELLRRIVESEIRETGRN
jgi:hypothetical protein